MQPYIQTTLAVRANAKLAFRFFGPFQVEQKIGSLSYRLQLPAGCKLHPVFHVSQLRKGAPPTEVHTELPSMDDQDQPHQVPEAVLDTRRVLRRRKMLEESLIRWTGLPASLATWENTAELRTRFPRASAWGQAASEEGENVMGSRASTTHGPPVGPTQQARRVTRPSTRYPATAWTT